MKSKILCMILSFIFIITAVPVSLAAEPGDFPVEIGTAYMELLKTIRVIEQKDAFNADESITRAYFTALVSRALALPAGGSDIEKMFRDVTNSHKYSAAIAGMYRMGYITGDEHRNFRPDDTITLLEAVTIAVKCLGYREQAESQGGYPVGYMLSARSLRLTNGVPNQAALTQADGARLVYNMIDTRLYAGRDSGVGLQYSSSENLLAGIHHIYRIEGIVSANGITGLTSGNANKNRLIVGDISMEAKLDSRIAGLIGMNIKAYYSAEDGIHKYLMTADTSKNDIETLIGWEDSADYDRSINTIHCVKKGRSERYHLSPHVKLIYNGRAEEDYMLHLADLSDASVRLIDNNQDGLFDVISVETYHNLVTDSVDTVKNIVRDLYNPRISLELSEIEMVLFTDMSGAPLTVADVTKWNVLSYYLSNDGKYARIISSSEAVSGEITETAMDGATPSYVIGGQSYRAAPSLDVGLIQLEVGVAGEFYLDTFGRIAAVFKASENASQQFGLLIEATQKSNLNADIQILMLSESGELTAYKTSKTIRIDGKTEKGGDVYSVIQAKMAMNDTPQYQEKDVVIYSVNSDGEINMIRFALPKPSAMQSMEDNALYCYKPNPGPPANKVHHTYKSAPNVFGDQCLVNASTVFFVVDYEAAAAGAVDDYSQYSATKGPSGMFTNDFSYRVAAYTTQKDPYVAEVVLYYGSKFNPGGHFVISTLSQALSPEDEIIYKATDGITELFFKKETVEGKGLKRGDIVTSCRKGSDGLVYDYTLLYDYESRSLKVNNWNMEFNTKKTYMLYPYRVTGNSVKYINAASRAGAEAVMADSSLTEAMLSQAIIAIPIIYVESDNPKNGVYERGSINDIVSYVQNPSAYSSVLVYRNYAITSFVVILKS